LQQIPASRVGLAHFGAEGVVSTGTKEILDGVLAPWIWVLGVEAGAVVALDDMEDGMKRSNSSRPIVTQES
jgi:hypothetical protein